MVVGCMTRERSRLGGAAISTDDDALLERGNIPSMRVHRGKGAVSAIEVTDIRPHCLVVLQVE